MRKKYNILYFQKVALKKGGKCISPEYQNLHGKLVFQCSNGHTWSTKASNIARGNWCKECSKNKYSQLELDLHFLFVSKFFCRSPYRKDIDYFKDGPSSDTYSDRFKCNWDHILEYYDLPSHRIMIDLEQIRNELIRIEELVKRPTQQKDWKKYSDLCSVDYLKRNFGSWNSLKEKANLDISIRSPFTVSELLALAKKYRTRKEFLEKDNSAYSACFRHGITKEAFAHMKRMGSRYSRAIYAIEFDDNSVYVGLTYNYDVRFNQHKNRSKFFIDKIIQGRKYEFIKFNDWYDKDEAAQKEAEVIEEYRKKGFTILNSIKAGGLGGGEKKWNKKKVLELAKNYKNLKEFKTKNTGAYQYAFKNNFLKELKDIVPSSKETEHGYWTHERIKTEALKFKTRAEFKTKSKGAYGASLRLKIYDEVTKHMPKHAKYSTKWTKDKVLQEGKKFKKYSEFRKSSPGAANAANKFNLVEIIKKEMIEEVTPGYWTSEKILEEAKKYNSKSEFMKKARGAYAAAKRLKIFDLACEHMKSKK